MHLSWPEDSAGLSRLDASSVPPEAEPAPISVWISSMNRMASGLPRICLSTPFRRCSKSPRYLVPASSAHVQRVDLRGLQDLGHFARDAPGQALGDGGLAHASLADQQRVVLAAAAQHLDDTLDLVLASDQGIDAAGQRGGVQVIGILIQRRLTRFALVFPVALLLFLHGGGLHLWLFGNAMRQEIDHVQARHALLLQVIDGVSPFRRKWRRAHWRP